MKSLSSLLITIIVFSLFDPLKAQDWEPPTLRAYEINCKKWEDTNTTIQNLYGPNGMLKVRHTRINDTTVLHEEFFESSEQLKLKVEVKRRWSTDTLYTISPVTMKDTMMILKGFEDVPHGEYTEYYEGFPLRILAKGHMKNGYEQGIWLIRNLNSGIVIANVIKGTYNGLYTEYHSSFAEIFHQPSSADSLIKWRGECEIRAVIDTVEYLSPINGVDIVKQPIVEKKSVPVGTWKHYDRRGNLIQTVTYDWLKD